jgi:hypothetical protein
LSPELELELELELDFGLGLWLGLGLGLETVQGVFLLSNTEAFIPSLSTNCSTSSKLESILLAPSLAKTDAVPAIPPNMLISEE